MNIFNASCLSSQGRARTTMTGKLETICCCIATENQLKVGFCANDAEKVRLTNQLVGVKLCHLPASVVPWGKDQGKIHVYIQRTSYEEYFKLERLVKIKFSMQAYPFQCYKHWRTIISVNLNDLAEELAKALIL